MTWILTGTEKLFAVCEFLCLKATVRVSFEPPYIYCSLKDLMVTVTKHRRSVIGGIGTHLMATARSYLMVMVSIPAYYPQDLGQYHEWGLTTDNVHQSLMSMLGKINMSASVSIPK